MHHWSSGLEVWQVGRGLPPAQSPHMNGFVRTRGQCTHRKTSADTSRIMRYLGTVVTSLHPPTLSRTKAGFVGMRPSQLGRFINHSKSTNTTTTVRGKWRIGFMSVRDIEVGEEILWDYGVQGEEERAVIHPGFQDKV